MKIVKFYYFVFATKRKIIFFVAFLFFSTNSYSQKDSTIKSLNKKLELRFYNQTTFQNDDRNLITAKDSFILFSSYRVLEFHPYLAILKNKYTIQIGINPLVWNNSSSTVYVPIRISESITDEVRFAGISKETFNIGISIEYFRKFISYNQILIQQQSGKKDYSKNLHSVIGINNLLLIP